LIIKLLNKILNKKVVSIKELPARILNKIAFHLQFPPSGFGRYHTTRFIKNASKVYDVSENILLDVGAGHQPYKKIFKNLKYESCDSEDVIKEINYDVLDVKHDFYCNINEKIPRPDNYYNIVLCSEVLEHVYNPKNVLKEINRILKDGGTLIATIPQSCGEHMLPHNYFNYLGPGIEFLLKESKFSTFSIERSSGGFHLLGSVCSKLLNTIFIYNKNIVKRIMLFPFEIVLRIIFYFINFLFFYLDFLDVKKNWTLHYHVIAKK